jgi:hypothetical protein
MSEFTKALFPEDWISTHRILTIHEESHEQAVRFFIVLKDQNAAGDHLELNIDIDLALIACFDGKEAGIRREIEISMENGRMAKAKEIV